MKELNASQFISRQDNFYTIRYINIKISQVRQSSRGYLEFTITFSLFYLFDCKFVQLMNFLFYKAIFARLKNGARLREFAFPIAPNRYRPRNLSRPIHVGFIDYFIFFCSRFKKFFIKFLFLFGNIYFFSNPYFISLFL